MFGLIAIGLAIGYFLKVRLSQKRLESSENLALRIIDEAKKEAETIKKEALLQTKENLLKLKAEFEKETRDRKLDLDNLERRIR
jgi:ribonuclease Y